MTTEYTERAFEGAIVAYLTNDGGYTQGSTLDFSQELAFDKKEILNFVKTTQPEARAFQKSYGLKQQLEGIIRVRSKDAALSGKIGEL